MAIDLLIPVTADFAALYEASQGLLTTGPVTDDVFTIRP